MRKDFKNLKLGYRQSLVSRLFPINSFLEIAVKKIGKSGYQILKFRPSLLHFFTSLQLFCQTNF